MSLTKRRRSTKTSSENILTTWTVSMAGLKPVDSVIFFLSFAFYVSASVKSAQENSNAVMEKRIAYAKAYNYEETVSG